MGTHRDQQTPARDATEIIARTEAAIAKVGTTVSRDPKTDLMAINHELVIRSVLARRQPQGDGQLRWRIRVDPMRYQR